MSQKSNTIQLTSVEDYDVNRMIFSDPRDESVPDSKVPIKNKRIYISTLYPDGTTGPLILPTERLFSFGIQENRSPETDKVTGHSMGLCLYDRDGPTPQQQQWVETFENIVEHCKEHVLSIKKEIGKATLKPAHLDNIASCLYRKKDEDGMPIPNTGTLYAKLIESKKNGIVTIFMNDRGERLDPMTIQKQYCHVHAAVKLESIFVGTKISLQVKLYQANIELSSGGMKPILPVRPKSQKMVLQTNATNLNDMEEESDKDDNDAGSINGDAEDVEESQPAKQVRKTVKRPVRKVKKVSA